MNFTRWLFPARVLEASSAAGKTGIAGVGDSGTDRGGRLIDIP
jgi:hypothetical protein